MPKPKLELIETSTPQALIKVIGVGGGGGNAVDHMVKSNIEGVEFICANTDAQVLTRSTAETILQIGTEVTKGLGAGANPEIGQQAALEDRERIQTILEGSDMVFITAGMGGGTGTGAAPIVAQIAKELNILTVGVITRPFPFEGKRRAMIAEAGIKKLIQHVDSLIIIPNEKLLSVLGKEATLLDAFKAANDVLHDAVHGITELITSPGLINLDLADVRTVMQNQGLAMMGTGYAKGEGRARKACLAAIKGPLLENLELSSAGGILVNMTAGYNFNMGEFDEMGNVVLEFASDDATVVIGTALEPDMDEGMRVTVIATGIDSKHLQKQTSIKVKTTPSKNFKNPITPQPSPTKVNKPFTNKKKSKDYLNIAALLNRQAN